MNNNTVQQIKERLSVEDVISSYIKLERAGKNFKAKCPFHNEKTPSFFVSADRGTYYCFGCGAKGDIFSFVQEFEGLDFKGALKVLAERAGVVLGEFNKEKEGEKEKLYRIMEEAALFFEKNLAQEKEVLEYLKKRGLVEKTIKDFRIGFVKTEWRLLYNYLKGKGFIDSEIEKAGLTKTPSAVGASPLIKGRMGGSYYDRFRGRVMFPISDSSGRIIAFSGRIFKDDGKSAKYLNSPDTPIFNKSAVLYGLDKAKDSIRKNNFSILVEGQMDLILSHQAGFRNTVATSGTALADSTVSKDDVVSNLGILRRLTSNIVLAFDGDSAGFNASMRAGKIALALGMDVKVASIEEGMDPADLISKSGVDAWRFAIRNSNHIVEFLLRKVLQNHKEDTRKAGKEIREKVLPFVGAIESSIEKADFIKKISSSSGIREDALAEDLAKVEREFKSEKVEIQKTEEAKSVAVRADYIERKLLGIILWQGGLQNPSVNVSEIKAEFLDISGVTEEELLKKTADEKSDLIFEAEVFYSEDVNLEKDIAELLTNFREERLKDILSKKMRELYQCEAEKDPDKSNRILIEINEVNKKIQDIKSGRHKKNI